MALKSVDDVDASGFDDDLFATETAYLAKNFRNFLRNNNRRTRDKNTAKPKEKLGQPSNNSMDPQCFGCQGYGHMKSDCPTYLRLKGKAMAVTLSDDEFSNDESGCNEDENFITFTATAVVNESVSVEENPSDGNSLKMQIFKKPTINFVKLLQRML